MKPTVTLMLFNFSFYAFSTTEGIDRTKLLLLMVSGVPNLVHLPRTLLVLEFPLGGSETFLCFTFVRFLKSVPLPGVAGWLANSVCGDFDIIKRHINTLGFNIIFSFVSQGVLMNCSCTCVCFMRVLVTVRYLCMV